MSTFTDKDREKLEHIHTNVSTLVKNDEDKEKRLRKVEHRQIHLIAWGGGFMAAIAAMFEVFKK